MKRVSLLLAFLLVATFLSTSPASAQVAGCPMFGGVQTQVIDNGACHMGPLPNPVTGTVPAGYTADYWNNGAQSASAGQTITTVEFTLKPSGAPAQTAPTYPAPAPVAGTDGCPTFGNAAAFRYNPFGDCKWFSADGTPQSGPVPTGYHADYWDPTIDGAIYGTPQGTMIVAVEATFKPYRHTHPAY